MDFVQVLRRCELFLGLDDSDLRKIASLPSWQSNTYKASEFIFHEDTAAQSLYILEDGEVSLVVTIVEEGTGKVRQVPVDIVTKGDIFGWSAVVAPHSRSMSAICVKPSTIISVSGTELNSLIDRNHALGYEVMKSLVRVIGRRLRDMQRKLAGTEKLPSRKRSSLK